ncbi:cell division protein ZapA [Novosphingobium sp. FKTRR1]|uniref:cell division protein ZapA n=1 Tax=unclassified Novosphingobium TaxID=2644732 RepID=UPI001CF0743D|nr:cell division protein ZapA [Novosphingobium sp. FKTRR1]
MPNLHLTIGGRAYTVSADQDEQPHIEMLGRMIDERARRAGLASGQSEVRMLLVAALMLADELHEEHRKEPPPPPVAAPQDTAEAVQARAATLARINALAERVEKLAGHLEEPRANA